MEIIKQKLDGVFEIRPKIIGDSRGYFAETYLDDVFASLGIETKWIQENQSLSAKKGTIRGLHFQVPPFAQAKLIRVVVGRIQDVFVDLRVGSETYGKWDTIELSDEACNSVYVPQGFAHGFCTLTENCIVQYKVDNKYSPKHERGILWSDPSLSINWEVMEPNVSQRDAEMPTFESFSSPFKLNGAG